MSNLFRLPDNSMRDILNTLRGNNFFDSGALDYAFESRGINPNPTKMTPQQIATMRAARQSRIQSSLGGVPAEWREGLFGSIQSAIDKITNAMPTALKPSFQFNTRDKKIYYTGDTGLSSDINKLRQKVRGQAVFFSPSWGVLMNYNKLSGAITRQQKQEVTGATNNDYMNRAARSTLRNLYKKAADPNWNGEVKYQAAAAKLQSKYQRMIEAVNQVRDGVGGLGLIGGGDQNAQ